MEKLANVLIKSSNSNYIEKHNDAFSKYLGNFHKPYIIFKIFL